MAIVRVQSAVDNGFGTPSVTLPGATTSGNFLLFYWAFVTAVAVVGTPAYNAASAGEGSGQSISPGGSFDLSSRYFRNITGTGTATVSGPVPTGSPGWVAGLIEYSGIKLTDPILDQQSAQTFLSTSPQNSGTTGVTIQAEEVAVGVSVLMASAITATPSAPYTAIGTTTNVVAGFTLTLADLILAATGTQNYEITFTSSLTGGVGVTTWRGANSGGGRIDFLPLLGVS